MDYKKLLKKAKEELPQVSTSHTRFEMPQVKGHIEGNKTIVNNFTKVCSALNRNQEMLLKYLQRELATPAQVKGGRLILGRKLGAQQINSKIEQFCKEFVLCKECGKPDTQLIREDRILFMRCQACGAKHPIRSRI